MRIYGGALAKGANNKRAAPSTRLAAANAILDRAHGRPTSSVELSGTGGKPLKQEFFHDGMSKQKRLIMTARLVGNLLEGGKRALEAEKRTESEKLIGGGPGLQNLNMTVTNDTA
jgi:hypothetical protein